GSSGLPQDTRLLFKALQGSGVHDLTGLVMENADTQTAHVSTAITRTPQDILSQTTYFLGIGGLRKRLTRSRIEQLVRRVTSLNRTYMPPHRYWHAPFDMALFSDTLWRTLFQRSLPAGDR